MSRTLSIRASLVRWFVLAAGVPALILGLLTLTYEARQTRRWVETQNLLTAESVAREVRMALQEPLTVLEQLAGLLEHVSLPDEEVNSILDRTLRSSPHFESIYIADLEGRVIDAGMAEGLAAVREDYIGLDLSRQASFQEAVSSHRSVWSGTFVSMVSGRLTMTLAYPMDRALLIGNFNIDHLRRIPELSRKSEGVLTTVLDRSGAYIFHPDSRLAEQHVTPPRTEPIRAGLEEGRYGIFHYDADGVRFLCATAQVPVADWLVMVSQEQRQAYASVSRTRFIFLVVIFFSVFIAMLWALVMANRFTRPMAQLAAGARAISGGDYDTPLSARGYEETEQLASSFREMITAVREREQRYTALAKSLPVGVFRTDAQGRCFWVNRAWEEISGLSLDEARGEGWSAAIHPEDRNSMLEAWGRHIHGEGTLFCECRFLRPDGEIRWIHARAVEEHSQGGEVTSHVGTITDITQRRLAEEELADSERRFRGLVANLPGVVYRCANDANWTMQYISDSIRDLTGYPASDFIENRVRSFMSVIHPDDCEAVGEHVGESLERGEPYVLEYRIIDRSGEIHWVYERGRGVFFEDGEFRCLDGVIFDITDRKQALAEKSRLEEQLRQAQKMEAIGQLAGGVAHDFNNLLLAILGNIEFVLDDLPHDAPVRDDLEQVKRAAEKAADLTRQLLAFSRRQMIQPVDLDPNEVITDLIKMLRRLIGGNIALEIVPGHGLHAVRADRGQIEQVLMNLVVNSRDAMPDGGRIVIRTANHELTEQECEGHEWAQAGPHVLLSVTDTGEGMDETTIAHIFEPFFTTKDIGKGTGLGLATVYGIVRQHSGVIQVSSRVGEGTTFKILLPKSTVSDESLHDAAVSEMFMGGETILLVEDDDNVRTVGVRTLEGAGYRVLEAENGAEAVRLFREHARTIDLVILDRLMPVMGGVEAQREIGRIRPGVRFIQCTGHITEATSVLRPTEQGDVPIIRKPYNRHDFLQVVRETLDR